MAGKTKKPRPRFSDSQLQEYLSQFAKEFYDSDRQNIPGDMMPWMKLLKNLEDLKFIAAIGRTETELTVLFSGIFMGFLSALRTGPGVKNTIAKEARRRAASATNTITKKRAADRQARAEKLWREAFKKNPDAKIGAIDRQVATAVGYKSTKQIEQWRKVHVWHVD